MNTVKHKPMRAINSSPARQSGLSLIELMIASVIGLVLLSGVVTIFSSNSASSKMSTGMTRLQDSGRVALDILSHSVRMAGYEGCRDEVKGPIEVLASSSPTVNFPDNAIWGSEVDDSGTWSPAVHSDLGAIAPDAKKNTDILYVQHGSGRSANLSQDMNGSGESIVVPRNPDQIKTGDLIMISDCETANLFRATAVNTEPNLGTMTIQHDAGSSNSQGNLTKPFQGTGDLNAVPVRVMRFESKAYFVGDSLRDMPNGDPVYSLFELDTTVPGADRTELIEGVEDFQVLYGVKTNPDSISDIRYVTADNVVNPGQIVSVQLGLLISTTDYSGSLNDDQTYNIAGWTVGPDSSTDAEHPADKRIRASFNATIQIRNRML